jgi:hypothetical protein
MTDKVSDMKTTIRQFQRNFKGIRQRAALGEVVEIEDAEGDVYLFKIKKKKPRLFGEVAGTYTKTFQSGIVDLATNKNHLKGLGRASMGR